VDRGNSVQAATLSPGGTWTAPAILATGSSFVASGLAADGTGDAVALLTQAATSPPGQGFGAPAGIASGGSIAQLAAAAGHALAIVTTASNLTAATEPVT
jgi:hypothetical protein